MLFGPQDFPDTAPRKRRARPNPCPRIPNTGWTARRDFPDLSAAKRICFDLETKDPDIEKFGPGWGRGVGHIVGAALGTEDGFRFYLPMRHEFPGSQNLDPHKVLDYLGVQLGRPHQEKVGHNMLYDLGWAAHEGVVVRGVLHDTWIAQKLLAFEDSASLEALSQRRLKTGKVSDLLYQWAWQYWGEGLKQPSDDKLRKTAMGNLWRSPMELVGDYAESDVDLPIRLLPSMLKDLRAKGLMEVYRMECDLLEILVQMRLAGVTVDLDAAEKAYAEIEVSINTLQKEIDRIAGRPISTGSPLDMEKLFTKLRIPFNRTDNGKMQLTGEYFESVTHPIGEKIIEIEELKKYNSTFIKNAILESNVNGKIHGEFNPLRAVTGRMSASSPNLQQIPSRNELAKVVRAIFIPDKGHDFWSKWDYSSIESRILAHRAVGAGSRELRAEYCNNPDTDYHKFTIDMVKTVTGIEIPRKHAKMINFGLCIAEGQLVLTDQGPIPIEKISLAHRIWDGVEWVRHEGIIYKGIKEVITYQGLTATTDHKVWLEDGGTTTLGEAKKCACRLARTQTPSGEAAPYRGDCLSRNRSENGRGILQGNDPVRLLREAGGERSSEHGSRAVSEVSVRFRSDQVSGSSCGDACGSVSVYGSAMRTGNPQLSPELQGQGHQGFVQILRRICSVGLGKMARRIIQKVRVRQDRQRWALLSGKSSLSDFVGKQDEYTSQRQSNACVQSQDQQSGSKVFVHNLLQHDYERNIRRGDTCSVQEKQESCGEEERKSQSGVRVYDILNAGPRRRFTCSGVLVSNCYGASQAKLAKMLGITFEESEPLFSAFHDGLPYVSETMEAISREVQERGYTLTVMGRRALFDKWEPRFTPKKDNGQPWTRPIAYDYEQALRIYGPNIKRAFLHKSLNYTIQGSAADLMKAAMVKCWKDGLFDEIGVPRLVVHDELDWSVPCGADLRIFREIKHTMETVIPFRIPIKVEGEWGPNWSEQYKFTEWATS